jgi:CheY-like chemotaxis protein
LLIAFSAWQTASNDGIIFLSSLSIRRAFGLDARRRTEVVQQGRRILVVDDDEQQIRLFSIFLELSGVADVVCATAKSIEAAVRDIEASSPAIVFLDNRIPPYSDFRQGLDQIRTAGYTGPVIVHSASVDEPVFRDAGRLGVASVVDKRSIRGNTLKALIEAYA